MHQQTSSKSLLIISTFGMLVAFTAWAAFSPLINQFGQTYNLSATEQSILVAIPVLLGSVMRIPLGILTEKYGGRKMYTALLLFLVLPLLATGFANSYLTLLICALFLGMAGTAFAISMTFVSKWTPKEKQGTALGINAMGNAGTAIAAFLLPTIALMWGVEWVFWGLILPVLIMAAVIWFFTPETPSAGTNRTVKGELSILKYKDTWVLSLFYFVTFGLFVAMGIYLPTLLINVYDLSAVDAGMRAAGFVLLATFVRPVGGYLADKYDPGKMMSQLFAGIVVCAAVIAPAVGNIFIFTAASLLLAVLSGMGSGVVFKMVPSIFAKSTGAATGIVGAAGGLGGFFPPIMLGVIRDLTGAYTIAFILLAVVSLVCFSFNKMEYDKKTVTVPKSERAGAEQRSETIR
ncbi:MFS transporter [Alkalicoccus daliensis]|uniref:MFS transporter, NNP family, nitrate/nitrite transporter n=1 Tax=Alkalicoccus daliensis TaxID=745820 RepID=A0A1H0E4Q7_9BACI|nr:MFS transporter, NNP family, nitrate/nitrite transporter [Alkalicoccus daliensis]